MPIEHIPILILGRRIGTGRIEPSGEMVITFVDPVPRDLVTMIQEGFVDGFTLTPNVLPAEPIGMDREPR